MAPASTPAQRGIRLTILLIALLTARAAAGQAPAPASSDDPFARRSWNLELGVQGALEAWNYNGSREALSGIAPGFTYGLGRGVVLTVAWPFVYVGQRGMDAIIFGTTLGVRGRFHRWGRTSLYWEFDGGLSQADVYVPPRGTRFNYMAQGGGGVTVRVRPGYHALVGVRWIHFSNNGLAGRDRNPDIEAIGAHIGILIAF